MINTEMWRLINGSPGYEISSSGRVRSMARSIKFEHYGKMTVRFVRERILKPSVSENGYLNVQLAIESRKPHHLVHRLVAIAFLDAVEGLLQVNHKNGIKTDNRVENLEWSNASENQKHRARTLRLGVGELHHKAKLTQEVVDEIRKRVSSGEPQKPLAKLFGVSAQSINRIVKMKSWITRLLP